MADRLAGSHIRAPAPTVLVVEDDENLLGNLGAFLGNHGFRALCATSVHSALKQLDAGEIDIVLIDYHLGRHSGIELLQQVRRSRPFLPVVLMSAYESGALARLVESNQPLVCLRKPFAGSDMLEALRRTRSVMQRARDAHVGSGGSKR